MKPSIQTKLQNLTNRYEELKRQLSDPTVTSDLNRYRDLSKEYAQIEPHVQSFMQYQDYVRQLADANALLAENDPELQQLAWQEVKTIEEKMAKLEDDLLTALIPKDPHDENNIFLE